MKPREAALVLLCLVLVVALPFCADAKKKKCILPALRGIIVEDVVQQPSGLTFSHLLNRLFMICDTGHCNYIFEFDEDGEYVRRLQFPKDHKDVEAVACYDHERLLYIGEESKRTVTAYHMPIDELASSSVSQSSFDSSESRSVGVTKMKPERSRSMQSNTVMRKKDTYELEQAFDFVVEAPKDSTLNNGLEGLTVNDRTGNIFCTNEKEPREIIQLTQRGEPIGVRHPEYAKDLSGLCYDNHHDLLWVLSDVSEALFATDVETGEVYDYWELDMENPEGIALNNDHDPPLLYISTDPSSPHGAQYVAALFIFAKPEIGTGLAYHDKCSFDDQCVGCDEIKKEAKENQKAFDEQQAELEAEMDKEQEKANVEVLLSVLLSALSLVVVVIVIVVVFIGVARREALEGMTTSVTSQEESTESHSDDLSKYTLELEDGNEDRSYGSDLEDNEERI